MDRRYFNFNIPNSLMTAIFSGEGLRVLKTSLPHDAEFITAHYDPQRAGMTATFHHESFPIVTEGSLIPFYDANIWIEHIEFEENCDE